MLRTEEEATQCWCPFARTIDGHPGNAEGAGAYAAAVNRGVPEHWAEHIRCIGSACMAFRWAPDADVKQSGLLIDEEDAHLATDAWWDGKYWRTNTDRVHRLVVEKAFGTIPPSMFVDHIDGDSRNNRRGNLRIVTKQQNAANAAARGGSSQYRGVHKTRNNKWAAQISRQGIRLSLGYYDSEEEAAAAYDEAARDVHGEYARLNLVTVENSGRRGYCGLAGQP